MGNKMKKKLRMEKKRTHDGCEICIIGVEGERNQIWILKKRQKDISRQKVSLRYSQTLNVVTYMHSIYRSLQGGVLNVLCEER